jgi:hypothetical protein
MYLGSQTGTFGRPEITVVLRDLTVTGGVV